MKYELGIIGGLGPEASSYFYQKLIKATPVKKDQDHINTIILSHATVPDRTNYILNKSNKNPLPYALNDIKILNMLEVPLLCITCNTMMSFYEDINKKFDGRVLNLIDDTIIYIKEKNLKKILVLATNGTISTKLYQKACDKYGIDYDIPNDDIQVEVMNIIYNKIKANLDITIDDFKIITDIDDKYDGIILGCTELSILKDKLKLSNKYIDPLEVAIKNILEYRKSL